MTCQEALSLLYEIIDNEASDIDAEKVREHLSHCKDCSSLYQVEASVNELLKEKIKSSDEAPKVDSLRLKVLAELDHVDTEMKAKGGEGIIPGKKKAFLGTSAILAIAATIVVLLGGLYIGSGFISHSEYFVPLERAHWQADENPDLYRNNASTISARSMITAHGSYQLSERVSDYRLVGGQVEEIDGAEMSHFLYSNGQKNVSVFLAPASAITFPDDFEQNEVTRGDITFLDHNCRGCRLVFHRMGDWMIVTATTDKDIDLFDFVPGRKVI